MSYQGRLPCRGNLKIHTTSEVVSQSVFLCCFISVSNSKARSFLSIGIAKKRFFPSSKIPRKIINSAAHCILSKDIGTASSTHISKNWFTMKLQSAKVLAINKNCLSNLSLFSSFAAYALLDDAEHWRNAGNEHNLY